MLCVYLLRLSPASISSVSFVYLMRLVCVMLCVYLLRLSRSSVSCVCLVCLVCVMLCVCVSSALLRNPPLNSFKHVKRVNSFKRPYASVLLISFILPPKQFERFDPFDPFRIFQAFDSYNYLSNSSVSIGSKCLPPRALQRVKINFFKRRGKPEGFEVFNSFGMFGVFGVYGVYGEIKRVRSVRGKHSYNTLKEFIYLYSCTYRLWRLYEQRLKHL